VTHKGLKRLGIDEITLVKGQGKFVVVLVNLAPRKRISRLCGVNCNHCYLFSTTPHTLITEWSQLSMMESIGVRQFQEKHLITLTLNKRIN
jgi:hypothetical protein